MAAAGAPLRSIQEWMGHRDYKTTEIYADYAPDPVQGARWAEAAFSEEDGDATDQVRLKKTGRKHALVVPLHRELRRGTLAGILRDADLSADDLRGLLD
jgi:hypothetical protein